MNFVLDASVTLAWAFEDEGGEYAQEVLARLETDDLEQALIQAQASLAISEAQLCQAAVSSVSLGVLLAEGAAIWRSEAIPRSTQMVAGGSAQWYALLLEHLARSDRKSTHSGRRETL